PEPVLDLQLEVPGGRAAPDEKCVLLDGVLRRALPSQRAIGGPPERRIAVPTLQGRAVEKGFESGVVGHRKRLRTDRWRATTPSSLRRTGHGLRSQGGGSHDGDRERVFHQHFATFTCAPGMVSHWRVLAHFTTASVAQSVARA